MSDTRNTTKLPLPENRSAGPDSPESGSASDVEHVAEREARSATAEARRAASSLKQTSRESADHVQQQVSEAADEVSRKASQAAERAKTEAISYFEGQKNCTADTIDHVGEALDRAAQTLHEEKDENLAHYTEAIAGDAHRTASYLRDRDYRAFADDARRFVRRHPVTAFAGLFAAGLAVSRFLKASETDESPAHARGQDEPGPGVETQPPSSRVVQM